MPRGIPKKGYRTLKNGKRLFVRHNVSTPPSPVRRTYQAQHVSLEPTTPTVHLERGSGGEYRYGVRAYGLTAEAAREEALRVFKLLEEGVIEIRQNHGLVKP